MRKGLATVAAAMMASTASPLFAAETTQGFSELAKEGRTMQAKPSCFMQECGDASKACFTNPSCLKGVTCLGRCRGEQQCATRCFARFGSERLNNWLSCTLEEKGCVTSGVDQDVSAFFAEAPKRLETFDPKTMSGDWWKVVGYSAKYDCFACQKTSFSTYKDQSIISDIDFRVEKLNGEGFWQNSLTETLRDERGPQNKASFLVDGKMYGLSFNEQWYILGAQTQSSKTNKIPPYLFVAYKGSTQQGPYDGAFVFTRNKDDWQKSPSLQSTVSDIAKANNLDPSRFCQIDNACPTGDQISKFGASKDDQSKDKLSWRDVIELTEWIRPGTLAKDDSFDPSAM